MSEKPSFVQIWVTAARPHTLTASIAPCIVSYATVRPPITLFLPWLIFCITVQIGTNLHNDYSDFVQGADTDKRIGQPRATAKGWLTPRQTCQAATASLTITFLSGLFLAYVTNQMGNTLLWGLILTSIFNAFAYTGGPYPLGYLGFGNFSLAYTGLADLFVLLYFGYVAVLMLPYLMHCQGDEQIDWQISIGRATSVGFLAMKILIVNNLRDRETDVLVNKRTTAVRFGRSFSLVEYLCCDILAYGAVLLEFPRRKYLATLLPLLSFPLALREYMQVARKDGPQLNQHVGGAAKVQLLFCLLTLVSTYL